MFIFTYEATLKTSNCLAICLAGFIKAVIKARFLNPPLPSSRLLQRDRNGKHYL